ncbi:hypothetical protein [Brevundimonas sp.]|uniref:hypothetical protein n=1 Tax=Brevundimonas sp. TaxID=1871086 RepID=UPI00261A69D8|nr:hypothetical protein [Brevundimonas sp.]
MNKALKAFLKAIATLVLWVGPFIAILGGLGTFLPRQETATALMGLTLAAYVTVCSLVVGGVLRLLLSIDDRLERLEGNL